MKLITLAIHTYDHAVALRRVLESEGIQVALQNVNLINPAISSGIRVRIKESDLPLALRIVENPDLFNYLRPSSQVNIDRSILIPIDFSVTSEATIKTAISIAKEQNSGITLLHSYIDPKLSESIQLSDNLYLDTLDNQQSEQIIASANGRLNKYADLLRVKMKDGELQPVPITTEVYEGIPEEVILQCIKNGNPFLTIMTTRTSQAKSKAMIGSVTAEVLESSRHPVLSIPENIEPKSLSPNTILFLGTNTQEDIIALDYVRRVFPKASSSITLTAIPKRTILRGNTNPNNTQSLCNYCKQTYPEFTFKSIDYEKITEHFTNYDMIVLTNRRKRAFGRMLSLSTIHKIILNSDIPTLMIPV